MPWTIEPFYLFRAPYISQNEDDFKDPNDWCLPLDENYGHLKETANPQEFAVNPEDVVLEPEYVQFGKDQWGDQPAGRFYWEPQQFVDYFYWREEPFYFDNGIIF